MKPFEKIPVTKYSVNAQLRKDAAGHHSHGEYTRSPYGHNDASYQVVTPEGVCPRWQAWALLTASCCKPTANHDAPRRYIFPDWLTFTSFDAWLDTQPLSIEAGGVVCHYILEVNPEKINPDTCMVVPDYVAKLGPLEEDRRAVSGQRTKYTLMASIERALGQLSKDTENTHDPRLVDLLTDHHTRLDLEETRCTNKTVLKIQRA